MYYGPTTSYPSCQERTCLTDHGHTVVTTERKQKKRDTQQKTRKTRGSLATSRRSATELQRRIHEKLFVTEEGYHLEGDSGSELMVESVLRHYHQEEEEEEKSRILLSDDMNSPYLLKNWCLAPFHPVSSSSHDQFFRRQAR
ncbi:hypothetical protein R1sor_017958 [Riccia sorocarpa]|uniref:Uncharacterized protein n=1 Tax=Riccia sorocarpa TaxID=122646 RepID=A0ABD3I8S6_9MARC